MISSPVTHLTGWSNYTRIHYADGSVVLKACVLKKLLTRPDYLHFIRISKGTAVNPASTDSITYVAYALSGICQLKDRVEELIVARRRIRQAQNQLSNYLAQTNGQTQ